MADEVYGIYDEQERCWIGNDEGPLLYSDWMLARLAAEVSAAQLGLPVTRHKAKVYDHTGNQLRETVDTTMSGEEALDRLEKGWLP